MMPIVRKKDSYYFQADLSEEELEIFKSLVGLKIETMRFKRAEFSGMNSIRAGKYMAIEVIGDKNKRDYVLLESLMEDFGPIIETRGAIWIKLLKAPKTNLKHRMHNIAPNIDSSYAASFRFKERYTIKEILVYGIEETITPQQFLEEEYNPHWLYAIEYTAIPNIYIKSISDIVITYLETELVTAIELSPIGFEIRSETEIDYFKAKISDESIVRYHFKSNET